jgi:hypothetical protein
MECMLLRASSVEVAYLGRVYVILILTVWQASKVQHSLTSLNAYTSSKNMNGSFPNLTSMYIWLW